MVNFVSKKEGKLSKIITEEIREISYSIVMKLIRNKDIKVNGSRVNSDVKINVGDTVELYYTIKPSVYYEIIYKDENVLIIDKKSGYTSEEIYQQLSNEFKEIYFIHRLDRNTSGLMVFAFNSKSENELLNGFKKHEFIKEYLTQVCGILEHKKAILTAYLVKNSESSTVKIYREKVSNSVEIKTGYDVIKEDLSTNTSIIKVRLYTGKTHQIRAHLAFIGHAIVGDGKYGDYEENKRLKAKSQRLISKYLTLKFDKNSPLYYLNDKTFCSKIEIGEN